MSYATELQELIDTLLAKGLSLREVRQQLARVRIHWAYTFSGQRDGRRVGHQGPRERLRRMRQFHLCVKECGRSVPKLRDPRICDDCLAAKWSE